VVHHRNAQQKTTKANNNTRARSHLPQEHWKRNNKVKCIERRSIFVHEPTIGVLVIRKAVERRGLGKGGKVGESANDNAIQQKLNKCI
jgi:hypothetical protein